MIRFQKGPMFLKRLPLFVLVCYLLAGISRAEPEGPATPAVSLLAVDAEARVWMALLVGTVEQTEMVFLERAAGEALLRERDLFLVQGGQEDRRFDLREWVAADVLILAESVQDEPDQAGLVRIRALDVVTGVRLADEVLEMNSARTDRRLAGMQQLLEQNILPAWQTLWLKTDTFAGVSVLDIRLSGAGERERHVFSSLDTLLQRLIIQDPSLVLLERNLLAALLQEEAISPGLQLDLQSSVVMLEGFIHRETDSTVFTLRGTTPSNRNLFEDVFPITPDLTPIDIADRALERLAEYFSDASIRPVRNLAPESRRFHRMAEFYHRRNALDRAVEAATTAFALHPTERRNTLMLYQVLYEQRMLDIMALENPTGEELAQTLSRLVELFAYLPTVPMDHSHTRWNARLLLDMVNQRFGDEIRQDRHLRAQWERLQDVHRRSLQTVSLPRSYSRIHESTDREKDLQNLIYAVLSASRPSTTKHIPYLLSQSKDGREFLRGRQYAGEVEALMASVKTVPEMVPRDWSGTFETRGETVLDDTYLRHFILAILTYLNQDNDPAWNSQLAKHIRTCAWLIADDPMRFPANFHALHRHVPAKLRGLFNEGFREVRETIEAEGWFVPELYGFEDLRQELILERLEDPSLRLVSVASIPDHYETLSEEMIFRALGVLISQRIFLDRLHLETTGQEPLRVEAFGERTRVRGLAVHRHVNDIHVWHDALLVHTLLPPDELYDGSALEVYHRTDQGLSLSKTIRFPREELPPDADAFQRKNPYQLMLGGQNHQYFSHRHSLYRFDDAMNLVQVVELKDWGFPGYMVANLLETPGGIYVALAKPFLDQYYDSEGRISGWGPRNSAGVLLFADEDLERINIIANTDRPEPLNDLDRLEAFDIVSMRKEASGTLLFAIIDRAYRRIDWFELDEEQVPKRRSRPQAAENIHAWLLAQNHDENEPVFDFMKDLILNRNVSSKLRHMRQRIFPGARPSAHSDARRLIPFQNGVIYIGENEAGTQGLFYLSMELPSDPPQTLWLLTDMTYSILESIQLWQGHVVARRHNGIHLFIREEALREFLKASSASLRFPGETHLQAQKAFQEEIRSRIPPFTPTAVEIPLSRPRDTFVEVPGGTFTLYPRGNRQTETVTLTLPGFRMAETKTTYEEFFRVFRWAIHNGYTFTSSLVFETWIDTNIQDPNRPMFQLTPVDALLYCNARSEMEGLKPAYHTDKTHQTALRSAIGNCPWDRRWTEEYVDWNAGYRLPSAAEWEWAARGADPDHADRFPWGDTISHQHANYLASDFYAFDHSTGGIHPDFAGHNPPVAPVNAFPPHGFENRFYGLVGNVSETVWERTVEFPQDDRRATRRRNPLRPRGGDWASRAAGLTLQAAAYGGEAFSKPRGFRLVLPKE